MEIFWDKLYRYDRKSEPCYIGIPFPEGEITSPGQVCLYQNQQKLPVQSKVTSRHRDGSVRFLFLRFLADLKGNSKTVIECSPEKDRVEAVPYAFHPICAEKTENGFIIKTIEDRSGAPFSFVVKDRNTGLFEQLNAFGRLYEKSRFAGPQLKTDGETEYSTEFDDWQLVENGPVCVILKTRGRHRAVKTVEFECHLTAWAGKPWVEVAYRLINTTEDPLHITKLQFSIRKNSENVDASDREERVSKSGQQAEKDPLIALGIQELEKLSGQTEVKQVRTCVAASNYKTLFKISPEGNRVEQRVEAQDLLKEANEHFPEVLYGTFFADYTDRQGGVCATIFQAQQNYPKAVRADGNGMDIMLVPEESDGVTMQMGMSREQKFLLHFHTAQETLAELDNRSLIYQMPDRPYVSAKVHQKSGVWADVFTDTPNMAVERGLIRKADGHGRAYGMIHFGDTCDGAYTAQGRGNGSIVWSNNEYDYPHACALLYVRTGNRRFLDYMIAACSHWMDVDVCHYHPHKEYIGGQWQHTADHCVNGVMACSHQWVEGLLDYYHFTGDIRGLETALGIGRNVNWLLDGPMFSRPGEANARETGWALRTLTALYIETRDSRWLEKCDRIIHDFEVWEEEYGDWLAPYTDNTVIRVGFMISIAVGSLMRYYREFPNPQIKRMILSAVDDLIENCYVEEWGCFYYKELPSLSRIGNNTLLLEALTIAYELTGNPRYLDYGLETFKEAVRGEKSSGGDNKRIIKDAVLVGGSGTKNFAQSFIPLTTYYRAAAECGLIGKDFLC